MKEKSININIDLFASVIVIFLGFDKVRYLQGLVHALLSPVIGPVLSVLM